jgi:hypothetical protein
VIALLGLFERAFDLHVKRDVAGMNDDAADLRVLEVVSREIFDNAPGAVLVPVTCGHLDQVVRVKCAVESGQRFRLIVDVHEFLEVAADDFLGQVAPESCDRGTDVPDNAAAVQDLDEVRRIVDQRVQQPVAIESRRTGGPELDSECSRPTRVPPHHSRPPHADDVPSAVQLM